MRTIRVIPLILFSLFMFLLQLSHAEEPIFDESSPMVGVLEAARLVAPIEGATILITGETGAGKDVVAQYIHRHGSRAAETFIAVNTTAIPENLLEAALFGHEKGAFTGAVGSSIGFFREAEGGTLFLDEIGDLPLSLQVKLLQVVEKRIIYPVGSSKPQKIDVRVIVATHRDLLKEVEEGRFRRDLYYRLNTLPIYVPPLRERKKDIPLLAESFLKKDTDLYRRPARRFSNDAMAKLIGLSWQGNVRELEAVILRAVTICDGVEILPSHIITNGQSLNTRQSRQQADSNIEINLKKAEALLPYIIGNQWPEIPLDTWPRWSEVLYRYVGYVISRAKIDGEGIDKQLVAQVLGVSTAWSGRWMAEGCRRNLASIPPTELTITELPSYDAVRWAYVRTVGDKLGWVRSRMGIILGTTGAEITKWEKAIGLR